jgi:tetratricopeptide (TPR) repeat protein
LELVSTVLPLYPHVWYFLAEAFYLARDFVGAVAASNRALELHPNCWYMHVMAGRAIAMIGDYSEALRHLRMAKLLNPEDAGLLQPSHMYTSWQERGTALPIYSRG